MRRLDREQDRQFALSLIDRCTHGVMALSTGEDTPYCLPLSFVRVGDDLYFHCAAQGRKLELLRRCSSVCLLRHRRSILPISSQKAVLPLPAICRGQW